MSCSRSIRNTACVSDELDMTVDGETDPYIIKEMSTIGVQVFTKNHTPLTTNCPEVILKVSLKDDPATYVVYDCQTLCSDCPSKFWNIADAAFKYAKVCYVANGATDGEVCIMASGKR